MRVLSFYNVEFVKLNCIILFIYLFILLFWQVYCGAHSRTLIFTETKNDANNLALNSILKQVGFLCNTIKTCKLHKFKLQVATLH